MLVSALCIARGCDEFSVSQDVMRHSAGNNVPGQ